VPADDRDGSSLAIVNAGDITIDGLEIELAYQPSRDFRLTLTNALMRTRADGFDGNNGYTDKRIEERVPDYSGSLFLLKKFGSDWDFSLVYSWVGEMGWEGEVVDAYTRLDLRLARSFRLGKSRGETSLVIQNASDEYEDYSPNREMDTRSYLSVKFDF
jgi:outer membrane receptor protein involved in Fe transport